MGKRQLNPNLESYEKVYQNFKWEQAYKELNLAGTKFNLAQEATDRQVEQGCGQKVAFYFDGPNKTVSYTYALLAELSGRFASFLLKAGIEPGDRVFIILPPCPETYISLLGTVKRGAIAGPLDYQWTSETLKDVLHDGKPAVLVTCADLLQKLNINDLPLRAVILVGEKRSNNLPADVYSWQEVLGCPLNSAATVAVDAEDPMLLMYTSGSTGRPKGVLHVHAGIVQYRKTGSWILDLHQEDVFWCTAEPNWIMGISYGVWAPLLNGATSVIHFGPSRPEEWYKVLQRYNVSVWYSTPSEFRRLMAAGDRLHKEFDLTALRHILSVGEPLNPSVIRWFQKSLGLKIYDTWWMTETGGMVLANFPSLPVKIGSMGQPCPGLKVAIVDNQGKELPPFEIGHLVIKTGWPAMMRQVWGDEEKYANYFRLEPWYLTGDLAYRDKEGYFWFQGRTDDIIKSNGRRLGPFEIESALVQHPAVIEAGVIGRPDVLKGEAIKAFVTLAPEYSWSKELEKQLKEYTHNLLPPYAIPDEIEACHRLPTTRNGKILRRVLKAWELGLPPGDLQSPEGCSF